MGRKVISNSPIYYQIEGGWSRHTPTPAYLLTVMKLDVFNYGKHKTL